MRVRTYSKGETTHGLENIEFATDIPQFIEGEYTEQLPMVGNSAHLVRRALSRRILSTAGSFPSVILATNKLALLRSVHFPE